MIGAVTIRSFLTFLGFKPKPIVVTLSFSKPTPEFATKTGCTAIMTTESVLTKAQFDLIKLAFERFVFGELRDGETISIQLDNGNIRRLPLGEDEL